MAVYGLKEYVDNKVATIVPAATTVDELETWYESVKLLDSETRLFSEIYETNFMDHMTRPEFRDFKRVTYVFFHTDEAQRDEFFEQQNLQDQKSEPARDRQKDMMHAAKEAHREATETEEERNRTIEERLGLDKNDPWDRRSEEEREADKAMKEQMKQLRREGTVSDDSFAGADDIREQRKADRLKDALAGKMSQTMAREQLKEIIDPSDKTYDELDEMTSEQLVGVMAKNDITEVEVISDEAYKQIREDIMGPEDAAAPAGDGQVHITDVSSSRNEDGSFNIEGVRAVKRGGEVDHEAKARAQAAHEAAADALRGDKGYIDPEDFAKALRGDGSGDAVINVEGDDRKRREGVSRPTLSDHAEAARRIIEEAEAAQRQEETKASEAEAAPRTLPDSRRASNTRDVTLTPKMWDEIDALVEGGDYADVSEVIREAIRAYRK